MSFPAISVVIPFGTAGAQFISCVILGMFMSCIHLYLALWMTSKCVACYQVVWNGKKCLWHVYYIQGPSLMSRSGSLLHRNEHNSWNVWFCCFAHTRLLSLIFINWVLILVWHANTLQAEIEVCIKVKWVLCICDVKLRRGVYSCFWEQDNFLRDRNNVLFCPVMLK